MFKPSGPSKVAWTDLYVLKASVSVCQRGPSKSLKMKSILFFAVRLLYTASFIAGFITSSSSQDGVQAAPLHSLEFLTSLTQLDPFLLLLLAILRNTSKDIHFKQR